MRPFSQPTPRIIKPKSPNVNRTTVLRPPKIASTTNRIKARTPFPWRPVLRIIVAALVAAFLVWLLNSPLFMVRSVEVSGIKNVSKKLVVDQVPIQGNLWLFPSSKVESRIKQASPYVADVVIYRGIPNAVRVVVAERVLAVLWESNGQPYIIGLDGAVIAQAKPEESIPRVVDTSNAQYKVGDRVATPGFIHFVRTVKDTFQPIMSTELDHLEVGETTFEVTVIPGSGPKILLDSTRNPETQLKAGKAVMDQYKDVIKEYLDLRVPGRGYFK